MFLLLFSLGLQPVFLSVSRSFTDCCFGTKLEETGQNNVVRENGSCSPVQIVFFMQRSNWGPVFRIDIFLDANGSLSLLIFFFLFMSPLYRLFVFHSNLVYYFLVSPFLCLDPSTFFVNNSSHLAGLFFPISHNVIVAI